MWAYETVELFPVVRLQPHPELEATAADIGRFFESVGCAPEEFALQPVGPIRILPDGTVLANWPVLQQVRARGDTETSVCIAADLSDDDPAIITMHAIAGAVPSFTFVELVYGVAFRHWLKYEQDHVSVRMGRREAREYLRCFGDSQRSRLQLELRDVFGRTRRELKRLAMVVDLPAELLRMYVAGRLTLPELKRASDLSPEQLEELQTGTADSGTDPRALLRKLTGIRAAEEALAKGQHTARHDRYELARFARALQRASRVFADPLKDLPHPQPAQTPVLRKGLAFIAELLRDETTLDELPIPAPPTPPAKKMKRKAYILDPLTGRRIDPLTGAPSGRSPRR